MYKKYLNNLLAMLHNLVLNKRYFVYQYIIKFNHLLDKNYCDGERVFRANYVNLLNKTVMFNAVMSTDIVKYERENQYSIPYNWIIKCQTLDEITHKQIPLPREIVDTIDSYL